MKVGICYEAELYVSVCKVIIAAKHGHKFALI